MVSNLTGFDQRIKCFAYLQVVSTAVQSKLTISKSTLFMGCGVVERHLEMAQPKKKTNFEERFSVATDGRTACVAMRTYQLQFQKVTGNV